MGRSGSPVLRYSAQGSKATQNRARYFWFISSVNEPSQGTLAMYWEIAASLTGLVLPGIALQCLIELSIALE